MVYYPETKTFPFLLPYELPYSTFMPYKPEVKVEDKTKKKSKKADVHHEVVPKGKRKKGNICYKALVPCSVLNTVVQLEESVFDIMLCCCVSAYNELLP